MHYHASVARTGGSNLTPDEHTRLCACLDVAAGAIGVEQLGPRTTQNDKDHQGRETEEREVTRIWLRANLAFASMRVGRRLKAKGGPVFYEVPSVAVYFAADVDSAERDRITASVAAFVK